MTRRPARAGRRHRQARRGGIAVLAAVMMIAVVGAALTTAAIMLRSQVQRTRSLAAEAQRRQMLTAGVILAADRAARWPGELSADAEPMDIMLPAALSDRGGSLTMQVVPDGRLAAQVRLRATLGGRASSQTLRFVRAEDRWGLVAAVLSE